MEKVQFDLLITIQATAPFTTGSDLDEAIERFISESYGSMFTGVPYRRFYSTKDGKPLNYDYLKRPGGQDWNLRNTGK